MFTGIVQACSDVAAIERHSGLVLLTVLLPVNLRESVVIGASIAINGVCLTVKTFDNATGLVSFDAMQETLELTNLGELSEGDSVNIERSATFDKEIGGHCVSGHVDAKAVVNEVIVNENNKTLFFTYPAHLDKYLFHKGFVALNGCSLTIAEKDIETKRIAVCYIPETLQASNHGLLKQGDTVNLEIDRQTQVVVDTVERVLSAKGLH